MKTVHTARPGRILKKTNRLGSAVLCLLLLLPTMAGYAQDPASSTASLVLARMEVPVSLTQLNLAVYADLMDGAGKYYALVIGPPAQLSLAGSFIVIDEYLPGIRYLIARERRPGARIQAASVAAILYDDGRHIIVRESPGLADILGEMGFALKLMSETPIFSPSPAIRTNAAPKTTSAFTSNFQVSQMISKVTQDAVNANISGLSGETPVTVEGSPYTITSRHTNSGTPLQKATQYVFEQLQGMGLSTSFQTWTLGYFASRNVVGELRGKSLPEEIVLLTAHIDDMPSTGSAPGADDNGSGSAALLTAANIMSRYRFQRTIRFVFFTGEEQGLYGSASYAAAVASQKIVAVLNLDMIAYRTQTAPKQRLHTRVVGNPGNPGDMTIANTFVNVVNNYGLAESLQPVITQDGETASDHSSFWDRGFAAILAIEDDTDDFNPYYHTSSDKLQYLNLPYCTAQVKASVGTTAHLAGPLPKVGPAPWELLLLSWQSLTANTDGPASFPGN
jgi:hypothetical protein